DAAKEVVAPVTLGMLIIMLVYVPILSLEGVEGKLYHPMAVTVLMALGASLLVAVLLMPVMAYLYLKAPAGEGGHGGGLYGGLLRIYEPLLSACLRRPARVVIPAALLFIAAAAVYHRLG